MNSVEVVELQELDDISQIIDTNKKYCCCVNCCKSCCINCNKCCEYFFCIKKCNGNDINIIIPIKNFFAKIFDKIVNLFKSKNNSVVESPKQNPNDKDNCCDKDCFSCNPDDIKCKVDKCECDSLEKSCATFWKTIEKIIAFIIVFVGLTFLCLLYSILFIGFFIFILFVWLFECRSENLFEIFICPWVNWWQCLEKIINI